MNAFDQFYGCAYFCNNDDDDDIAIEYLEE